MRRAGLSETMAVVILVAAALVIASVIAVLMIPWSRGAATAERLQVSGSLKVIGTSPGLALLKASLQNPGDAEILVTGVSLVGVTCTPVSLSLPLPLRPGESAEVMLECNGVSRYSRYALVVTGLTPAKRMIEAQTQVMAE